MGRKSLVVLSAVALVALGSIGYVAYSYLKPPAEASGTIQAIPLNVEAPPAAPSVDSEVPATVKEVAASPTSASNEKTHPVDAPAGPAEAEPAAVSPSTAMAEPPSSAATSGPGRATTAPTPPSAQAETAPAKADPAPVKATPAKEASTAPAAAATVETEAASDAPGSAAAVKAASAPASGKANAQPVSGSGDPAANATPATKETQGPGTATTAAPATSPAPGAAAEASPDDSAKSEAATSPAEPTERIFQIEPENSSASFDIDEVLRGQPKTVIGTTDQVAGQFGMVGGRLSTVKVGPVLVNARTFATDNRLRDRSIKNKILKTDDFEYIRFQPTSVEGLPDTVPPGESFNFQVAGDLTITDVTKPVTFQMQARFLSASEIEGLGTTAFPWTEFQLSIPKPPVVASVADTVHLELKFQAKEVY